MTRCLLPLLLLACGPGDAKLLTELDEDDRIAVCEEFEPRTVSCGEPGVPAGLSFSDRCAEEEPAPASCTATVGDYRACYAEIEVASDEDLCAGVPAVCAPLFDQACRP